MLFSRLTVLFVLLSTSLIFQACGVDYKTNHVRDYSIYIESSDPEVIETVHELANDFNAQYGEEVLKFVDTREQANSFITFTSDLLKEEGKLGYGNWIATTTMEEKDVLPTGHSSIERTIVYAMDIEFDLGNFVKRTESRFDKNSRDWSHLYHLFCHEVGHGMQMDHSEIENSVMFKSIASGSRPDVDYDQFFAAAKTSFKPIIVED